MIKTLIIIAIIITIIAIAEIIIAGLLIKKARGIETELEMYVRMNNVKAIILNQIERLTNNLAYGNYKDLLDYKNKIKGLITDRQIND